MLDLWENSGSSQGRHLTTSRPHPKVRVGRMRRVFRSRILALIVPLLVVCVRPAPIHAQDLAKRLILKDGSYQSVNKYEVKGDRVRYLSAERGEWEELPKSMVDWPATEKYAKDRASGASTPEAVALDKEREAERQAEEARSPHV